MTPNCLRRLLSPYAARLSGYQGYHAFPHSVMGVGVKAPCPATAAARLETLVDAYHDWLRNAEAGLPIAEKVRRWAARLYRSKGERYQIGDYYTRGICDRRRLARLPVWERGSAVSTRWRLLITIEGAPSEDAG